MRSSSCVPCAFIFVCLTFLASFPPFAQTYRNPILSQPQGDPFIYIHSDGFYYWALSIGAGIAVMRSGILTNWNKAERRAVFKTTPPYDNVWAPEIHFIKGNFYIYFNMGTNNQIETHRNYVIKALDPKKPLGSYSTPTKLVPFNLDSYGLDGTVLNHPNGNLYFIWSSWPSDDNKQMNLYIARMADPMELRGTRVLLREPKYPWETDGGKINAGPQVLAGNGTIFVTFFASIVSSPNCCVGMMSIANSKDPLLPNNWSQGDKCVFARNDAEQVYGPGHASYTTSPDGVEDYIVYHAMSDSKGSLEGRTARAQRFSWVNGVPEFGKPRGLNVTLPTPSGQFT